MSISFLVRAMGQLSNQVCARQIRFKLFCLHFSLLVVAFRTEARCVPRTICMQRIGWETTLARNVLAARQHWPVYIEMGHAQTCTVHSSANFPHIFRAAERQDQSLFFSLPQYKLLRKLRVPRAYYWIVWKWSRYTVIGCTQFKTIKINKKSEIEISQSQRQQIAIWISFDSLVPDLCAKIDNSRNLTNWFFCSQNLRDILIFIYYIGNGSQVGTQKKK